MTNKEKQEMKALIRETVVEVLKEDKKVNKAASFDFDEYKTKVVADDIRKLEEFAVQTKGVWYLPIVGMMIYLYHQGQALTSIDRGVLRKNLNKATLPWLWILVPFVYIIPVTLMFNFLPSMNRRIAKKAIKMTKEGSED